ncbi:basic leucine zipper 61-like [Solanum dulcamara]|uniref:basic leucine zipper 61-like n=1 Tax=Solanum dulcamara TaxID=45834 RepID=UPI0024857FA3|nr:basic leucine zipper 61-like [Solanum dulcamara]
MNKKQKRSDEPKLDLSLETPNEYESVNRIPTLEEAMNFELKHDQIDPNVDLRKLRRRMSNRFSAQRSRMKRVEYKTELEKEVKYLQDMIALMRPKLENAKDNKKKLQLENELLKEKLDSITVKSNFLTVQTEQLKVELKRFKELAMNQEADEHMEIEGQSSNTYDHDDSESAADIDVDQYLNLDTINFFPSKNDDT